MSELTECMTALEKIGKSMIRKSLVEAQYSPMVAKAMAIDAGSKTAAGALLARRILELEKQRFIRKSMGWAMGGTRKRYQKSDDDWWSSQFSPVEKEEDEDDEIEELQDELARLETQRRRLIARADQLGYEVREA